MCIGWDVERVALNPYWVSLSLSSRAAWSLVWMILAKSLYDVFRSDMGR